MVSWGDDRARIRRALIDLCWERGFASLTLNDLLARAAVDEPTFHRYFADPEDCFFEVYKGELERFRHERTVTSIGFVAWRDRLRATAYALYRFLAADERIRHLVAAEVRAASERSQVLIGQEVEALFDLIDEGRGERPENTGLTRATAETMGGAIFNQIYSAASQKGRMPAESEIVPELMYATVLPYLGEEAAREELSEPASDHRRSPVFAALMDLCWERDVTGVTMDAMAERAGVPAGEIEGRFGDVDGCLNEFFEAEKIVLFGSIDRARSREPDWRGRLRATAYALLDYLHEDEKVAKLTSVDVRMASERVQLNWASAFFRFVDYVDEANAELPPDEHRGREVAESVSGGIFQQLWARTGGGGELPDPREVVPELMYAAVLPYLGDEAARAELTMSPPGAP